MNASVDRSLIGAAPSRLNPGRFCFSLTLMPPVSEFLWTAALTYAKYITIQHAAVRIR